MGFESSLGSRRDGCFIENSVKMASRFLARIVVGSGQLPSKTEKM